MRIRVTALLAVAALSLAACGGNDQGDVADEMVKQAADAGMDLDKACVQKLAEGMSDEDVKSLDYKDITVKRDGDVWDVQAAYSAVTPFIGNISFLVDFDKTVQVPAK